MDTIRNFGSLAGMNTSVEAILNSQSLDDYARIISYYYYHLNTHSPSTDSYEKNKAASI
jgi:hypothetical protein